jgi:hypothetical protein
MRARTLLVAVVLAVAATPAVAQVDYEQMYGRPVDVSISDISMNPEQYQRRAVRTRGRLDLPVDNMRSGVWMLRDGGGMGSSVLVVPMPEAGNAWDANVRTWVGQTIEITGVVERLGTGRPAGTEANAVIRFWSFTGPEEKAPKDAADKAAPTTLELLVSRPGSRDDQLVKVVGKFRGKNLYGDLASRTQLRPGDWVIKNDVYAVWVTGRKPKGRGWELDPDMKKDTDHWIEVVGKPTTRAGVTYIHAVDVRMTTPPSETAKVAPPSPPPPPPRVAPVVVFALPLDGEAVVAASSRFTVQFSKDMDVDSFKGRVVLSYAPLQPGDRAFDHLTLSYDGGLRALTVDPGDQLREGRSVELRFLPGIVDVDGLELVPRSTAPTDGSVDVLRYFVGS